MEFNKKLLKTYILFGFFGFIFLGSLFTTLVHPYPPQHELIPLNGPMMTMHAYPRDIQGSKWINKLKNNEILQDDSQSLKNMKEQMENDRIQQRKIRILKMELEQTNLKLEQEKAISEINKLQKDKLNVIEDPKNESLDKFPDIIVDYIGGTQTKKEAILSINGNKYSVFERNKPIKNAEVISISDSGVVVHFDLPQELNETIVFKPE